MRSTFHRTTTIFTCCACISAFDLDDVELAPSVLPRHPDHARCGEPSARLFIAVGFYGLAYRGLEFTLPSIEQHCFRILAKHGISFDLLVHTYFVTHAHASGMGDSYLEPLDPYAVVRLRPCVLEMEDQATVLADLKARIALEGASLQDLWNDGLKSVHNYLLALRSLSRLAAIGRMRSAEIDRTYDAVLILRADTLLTCDVDLPRLIPALVQKGKSAFGRGPRELLCTAVWGAFGGVNDRLLIGTANATFTLMSMRQAVAQKNLFKGTHPANGETLLRRVLVSIGIHRCATSMVVQRLRPRMNSKNGFDIPRLDKLSYLRDELTQILSKRNKRSWWRTAGTKDDGVTAAKVCAMARSAADAWNRKAITFVDCHGTICQQSSKNDSDGVAGF
mmetsp:Transcript_2929/g.8664  ORF Transcript_2929/g.8664 Transcript_2929/m.8664 type:complete len:392 (+) Transcript_2929:483-1658(+)